MRRRRRVQDDASISRLDLPNIIFGPALALPIGQILLQQEGANLLWAAPLLIVVAVSGILLWKSIVSKALRERICGFTATLTGFAAVAILNAASNRAWSLPIVFGPGQCLVFVTVIFLWWLSIELVLRLQ